MQPDSRYKLQITINNWTNQCMLDKPSLDINLKVRFLITAAQLGTRFTVNISLALQYVGKWCIILNALLYATCSLCKLRAVYLDHNWQVYKGVQKVWNNTFLTSSEHIWKRLDRTLPWAYNCRLCLIISSSSDISLQIMWPRYFTLSDSPIMLPFTVNTGGAAWSIALFLQINTLLFL